jgi:N-acetylglucosaminyldiphosphoundecaprenol N-acetyl-beta-D-mannosaminyltransferase
VEVIQMKEGSSMMDMAQSGPAESITDSTALRQGKGPFKVDVCGVMVDHVSLEGLLDAVMIRIERKTPGYIVTPNVDHVCLYHRNEAFKRAYQDAFMVVPDGVPLIWSARLLGTPLVQRLNGTDLVYAIAARAAAEGRSIFLLGAAEGVSGQAAERLKSLYPGLRVAGTYSPPMGFERSEEENDGIVERLRAASPDICFAAVGSPKQEIWMQRYCRESRVPLMIGVGASLDFIAGNKRRAPRVFQKAGLEWLWRLCTEPRRLWRRYLVDDMFFFVLLARQIAASFLARRRGPGTVVGLEFSKSPRRAAFLSGHPFKRDGAGERRLR